MKVTKIKEAIESGGSIPNTERQISGMSTGFAPEAKPTNINPNTVQKPSTDLFPFEIDKIKSQLSDIQDKTFALRGQCAAALQNPSVKQNSSKRVGINNIIKELDDINKTLIEKIPNYFKIF